MDRREALKKAALLLGGTLSAPTLLAFSRWQPDDRLQLSVSDSFTEGAVLAWTDTQRQLVAEVAEMILPKTDTPGAKDAGVPAFVEMMVQDCYQVSDQKKFVEGLVALEKSDFLKQSQAERTATLKKIEADAKATRRQGGGTFWRMVKELTLLGYYSSEMGIKASFIYEPIPSKLENIKIKPDQKAFVY